MNFYNLDFDITAIIIYIVVVITYFQKKHIDRYQHTIFLCLFITSILTPLSDIPAAILIENHASWILTVVVNSLYYLTKQGTTFFFMFYLASQVKLQEKPSLLKQILFIVPISAMSLLILINPFTGWLFSYSLENGVLKYHSGVLRTLSYIVSIYYYLWVFRFIRVTKKSFNKTFRILVRVISFLNIAVQLSQLLNSSLLLHSLAFSVSMLLLVVNIDRYGMVVDPITGMAKREHLESVCSTLMSHGTNFSALMIKVADYDVLSMNFGAKSIEFMIQQIERYLITFAKIGNAFKVSNNSFVLLFIGDYSKNEMNMNCNMIYDSLKRPWLVNQENNVETYAEFFISTVSVPNDFSQDPSLENFMSCVQFFTKYTSNSYGVLPVNELKIGEKEREKIIEKVIERGLKENLFEIHYQPICTAKDKTFVTAEALLRLTDPDFGRVGPDEFIPIAEKNGSILQLGSFVLESVCDFIEHHDMEKLGLQYIEVNLSTIQCMQTNFIEIVEDITKHHNVDSKYICFEITETASNCAPEIFSENLRKLTSRGFILALDDFGTGYGNLQRMVTSDFKLIKFDKNMTQQLSSGNQLQKVYSTLHAMIETMGSKVVSEGVETEDQYEFIKEAGNGYIQGFYFSKPLPADEFCKFLENAQKK